MIKVIILSGIPGSGKSTYAAASGERTVVCSADHYFEKSGSYRFDPSKLGEAHAECLRRFVDTLSAGTADTLIVDNTNTTALELAPYVAVCAAFGVVPRLVTVECDPEVAYQRNQHGVPLAGIQAAARRLRERQLPPFWNVTAELVVTDW